MRVQPVKRFPGAGPAGQAVSGCGSSWSSGSGCGSSRSSGPGCGSSRSSRVSRLPARERGWTRVPFPHPNFSVFFSSILAQRGWATAGDFFTGWSAGYKGSGPPLMVRAQDRFDPHLFRPVIQLPERYERGSRPAQSAARRVVPIGAEGRPTGTQRREARGTGHSPHPQSSSAAKAQPRREASSAAVAGSRPRFDC
jgi:hypothetical protein